MTYKAITTNTPPYLADLLAVYKPYRVLRSSFTNRLHVDRHRTVFGGRAFRHAAPSIWNNLPSELTENLISLSTFKKHLKTHLYRKSLRS
jgi:hypothetical protein